MNAMPVLWITLLHHSGFKQDLLGGPGLGGNRSLSGLGGNQLQLFE